MRLLMLVCFSLLCVGCQYSSSARVGSRDQVFIRQDGPISEDSRWPTGTKPPAWYVEGDTSADETVWAGRPELSIEAKSIRWRSLDDLAECLRLFRLEHVGDTEFTLISDRKARGIVSGQWRTSCYTAPRMVLHEGQSSWVTVTCQIPGLPSGEGHVFGVVVFALPVDADLNEPTLRVSAQGICGGAGGPPPSGYRRACWSAGGERAMGVGKWYMQLAESEDPQSTPFAFMVRIAEITPPTS